LERKARDTRKSHHAAKIQSNLKFMTECILIAIIRDAVVSTW
jgi:hypothetical protein